jgi:hypothetical protein
MKKQAFIYSLKVWLTTLILAPLMATSINLFVAWYSPVYYYFGSGFLIGVNINIIEGALIVPALVFFWFSTYALLKKQLEILSVKVLLTLIVSILVVVFFLYLLNWIGCGGKL